MAAVYFTLYVPLMGEMSKSRKSQIVKLLKIFICDFPTDKSPFLSFTLFDFFFKNKNFMYHRIVIQLLYFIVFFFVSRFEGAKWTEQLITSGYFFPSYCSSSNW